MLSLFLFSLLIGIGVNSYEFASPLRFGENQLEKVPCPDGSDCSDGETCCQLSSGAYACCPHPDAVCCSDHIHCCPTNHTCDIEKGHCKRQIDDQLNNNQCPDGVTACPNGYTCCQLENEGYGCCPLNDAVCCNDHVHCCPQGHVCNMQERKCQGQLSIPWFTKKPAFRTQQKLIEIINKKEINISPLNLLSKSNAQIICPDATKMSSSVSTIQCPDGNFCPEETTCCELKNNTYGCCPYSDGACCSDQIHCCGNGYSCDESGTRCVRHLNKSNKMKKLIYKSPNDYKLCPDERTNCSLNTTCCPTFTNNQITYSCCPYPNGVCCGLNGSVCCPNNYDCNEEQLSCQLRDSIVLRKILLSTDYYQCQSSSIVCSTDQTCCDTYGTTNQDYACCPYPNGQCCSDGQHCCPSGTNCDMILGGCL